MKKFILISLLVCVSVVLRAQQDMYYTYDAAGNRTGSHIFWSLTEEDAALLSEGDEANGLRGTRYHVTAAPNPTRGYLQVQVAELGDDDLCTLTLFDSLGRKVLSQQTRRVLTTLDLTSLGTGLYLLRADINGESTSIKIIRED